MTRGELLEFLTARAKEFRKCEDIIVRNKHLTGINTPIPKSEVDGVLVAFINYVGIYQGIDYALDFTDLNK